MTEEARLRAELYRKATLLPFYAGEEIVTVIAAKSFTGKKTGLTLEPEKVLSVLRH